MEQLPLLLTSVLYYNTFLIQQGERFVGLPMCHSKDAGKSIICCTIYLIIFNRFLE